RGQFYRALIGDNSLRLIILVVIPAINLPALRRLAGSVILEVEAKLGGHRRRVAVGSDADVVPFQPKTFCCAENATAKVHGTCGSQAKVGLQLPAGRFGTTVRP